MKEKNSFTLDIKVFIKIVLIFGVLVIFLLAAQRLLVPKYTGKLAEGALIGEYYDSDKNNDVLFFGDSEMYYNFSPKVLAEEYKLTAYIRGSANQTMWQSYYLLMDSLEFEKPKAVVVSVSSMMKDETDGEAYNRMTIDGMAWSEYKYRCIKVSMTDEEEFVSYIFPILRYHSRWSELGYEDFKYFISSPNVSDRGYIEKREVVPMGQLPNVRPLEDYELSEKAYDYLDMIRETCAQNDIKLILVKSPSQYPHWYDEWEEQIEEYAKVHKLTYINLLETIEASELDFSEDTFDGGLHLNISGAVKNTRFFGKILVEELK